VTETTRLVVDASHCDGHGICVLRCPEMISLDEWGYAKVEPDAVTDTRILRRARRAVAACPSRALTLVTVRSRPGEAAAPHLAPVAQPETTDGQNGSQDLPGVHNRNNGRG
jgi:ferredoxin